MIHIVLFHPEIPQNTGNIMRTCAATGIKLHLIEPLGFIFDEKRVKRSVMDYFDYLDYERHVDWEAFTQKYPSKHYYLLSRFAKQNFYEMNFNHPDEDLFLVFGSEGHGLPDEIKNRYEKTMFRLPMKDGLRSLNLANTVAIVAYEVLRQQGFPDLKV